MDQWLDRQLKAFTGEIMFPRWDASQRGTSKYEVHFTFTLIDAENRIVKRGYAWPVDMALMVVGTPRELAPEYSPGYNRSDASHDEYRRAKEAQSKLE